MAKNPDRLLNLGERERAIVYSIHTVSVKRLCEVGGREGKGFFIEMLRLCITPNVLGVSCC